MLVPKFQMTDPVTADQVNRMQDGLRQAMNPLLKGFSPGNTVTATLPSGVPTAINHGLGKAWTGWYLVDIDAAASVFRAGSQPNPLVQIVLQSTANVNVVVVVF